MPGPAVRLASGQSMQKLLNLCALVMRRRVDFGQPWRFSMERSTDLDAVIIGAGMAGLACAHDLVRAGWSVRVVEAGDQPGGRMRSDRHDGFVLDRGFQVLNTSYPQMRCRIRPEELEPAAQLPKVELFGADA